MAVKASGTITLIRVNDGAAGKGIKSISNKYAASASSTQEPTAWVDTVPSVTSSKRYLWNYEIVTYTDNTTQETHKRIIAVYGDKGETGNAGRGIKSITEYYLASGSSSGVTTSTAGWTTAVQSTTTTKRYLWNYEVVAYTDNTSYTSVPVIIGTHGATGSAGKDAAIISNTEPSDKTYMWCDTSVDPPILKRWNGVDWSIVNDSSEDIIQIYKDITAAVKEAGDSILLQVGEKTYTKDDINTLIGEVNTEMEQTKDGFNFEFNNFKRNLDDLVDSTDSKFEHVQKYIRFIDGAIYIGIEGNPIMLKQINDRISFIENNAEVAYISNRTMYITHAEVLKDLKIGRFAWVYMDSGYLPLRLV